MISLCDLLEVEVEGDVQYEGLGALGGWWYHSLGYGTQEEKFCLLLVWCLGDEYLRFGRIELGSL